VVASSRLVDGRNGGVSHIQVLVAHINLCGAVDDSEAVRVYGCQVGSHVHRQ
jgi:hypothetical protein